MITNRANAVNIGDIIPVFFLTILTSPSHFHLQRQVSQILTLSEVTYLFKSLFQKYFWTSRVCSLPHLGHFMIIKKPHRNLLLTIYSIDDEQQWIYIFIVVRRAIRNLKNENCPEIHIQNKFRSERRERLLNLICRLKDQYFLEWRLAIHCDQVTQG